MHVHLCRLWHSGNTRTVHSLSTVTALQKKKNKATTTKKDLVFSPCPHTRLSANFHTTTSGWKKQTRIGVDHHSSDDDDPREDAVNKKKYKAARYPVVLCHGFSGFDSIGGNPDFRLDYWYGVRDVLEEIGCTVYAARVPPFACIKHRAQHLHDFLVRTVPAGTSVNLVGHSMGGLDCRYLISHLQPSLWKEQQNKREQQVEEGEEEDEHEHEHEHEQGQARDGDHARALTSRRKDKRQPQPQQQRQRPHYTVKSLTTLGTPHRGSPFADYVLSDLVGTSRLEWFWTAVEAVGLDRGGVLNLTTSYLQNEFNPNTPDDPRVQYFSYAAAFQPGLFSRFRFPWAVIMEREGPNDGLVSVASARWGTYIRTIENADHLDLMNWANLLAWSRARFPWILGGSSHDAQGRPKGLVETRSVEDGESDRGDYEKSSSSSKDKGGEDVPPLFNALQLYLEISDNLHKHGL